jgi:hypothetical protein
MTLKLTITIIFSLFTTTLFGLTNVQCDSITVYNAEFDKLFQDEYNSIKADTIIAIRHCGTTNGCSNTFGLLIWQVNGQVSYKKIQRKNGEISSSDKLDFNIKLKLDEFYDKKIYNITGELDSQYWIDDGPLTLILFKTNNYCWRFSLGKSTSKDKRVVWTNEFLNLILK